jgi:hypothetical protein
MPRGTDAGRTDQCIECMTNSVSRICRHHRCVVCACLCGSWCEGHDGINKLRCLGAATQHHDATPAQPIADPVTSIALHTRSLSTARISMDNFEYDLVTIGAGSGGVRASRFAAANYKKKVACIELPFGFVSSDTVGGAGGT